MSGSGHSVPVEVFIPSHKLQDMSVVIYKYKEIIIQTCLWMASSTSEMRSLLQCFVKWFILEFGSSTTINFSKSESDCELWDYPCNDMCIRGTRVLIVFVKFCHTSSECWLEYLVAQLLQGLFPLGMQPLQSRQHIVECQSQNYRKGMLGLICMLQKLCQISV